MNGVCTACGTSADLNDDELCPDCLEDSVDDAEDDDDLDMGDLGDGDDDM